MGDCCGGVCVKCRGGKWLVFGVVLLIVTWWAKSRGDVYLIWYALGVLVALKGLMKLAMPNCPHCAVDMPKKKR
ncbi:hypothetical protein HYV81_04750 [Candidatus Woesearchaeota archaeon]|nr:hypothetical protein [Candidatus Woesearchaeota archaeon]